MNLPEDVGFFGLGLLIGGLLIDLRYRYRALVAQRLMGKEGEILTSWWSDVGNETKGIILVVPIVALAIALIISVAVGATIYYNKMEIEAAKEGVVVTKENGWSRWAKSPVPPIAKKAEAEEKQ